MWARTNGTVFKLNRKHTATDKKCELVVRYNSGLSAQVAWVFDKLSVLYSVLSIIGTTISGVFDTTIGPAKLSHSSYVSNAIYPCSL